MVCINSGWGPKMIILIYGLTILHISDLHIKGNDSRQENMIKKLEDLNPDLILITGDFIDYDEDIQYCADILGKLKVKIGKFGVFGNHDYYRYNAMDFITRNKFPSRQNDSEKIAEVLNDAGMTILVNSYRYLNINGRKVCVIGVGDNLRRCELARVLPDDHDNSFKILMCHYPDVVFDSDISKVDLVLTGHTHGGQVRLPIIGAVISWSKVPLKSASGLFRHNGTIMHISPGIGTATLPMRFLCRPEATLLELRCVGEAH